MRIEILRQTSIAGRAVRPGDVVEASESDGRYLIASGKARLQDPPIISTAPSYQAAAEVATPRKPRNRRR